MRPHVMALAVGSRPSAPENGGTHCTATGTDSERVHIRAADLREAERMAMRVRADAAGKGVSAPLVILDVDVLVDTDPVWALERFAALLGSGYPDATVRYVGTPDGLAGLLADIHAAGIADEVSLAPMCEAMLDRSPDWAAGLSPVPTSR